MLTTCLLELSKVRGTHGYAESKRLIVADVGALLFEAPTGTGKTLMAGHVAERLSQLHTRTNVPKIIWFWFAPFTGLIDQAVQTIRTEFDTLRPKNPANEREPSDLKSGDVFVTTWASVAVSNEASRKSRTSTEEMPSIDNLVAAARAQGFVIGVVIDEAHHTFRGQTQAFAFYRTVLDPELTILATATPRDKDVEKFTKATGITNLRRITISRQDAIDERLIKEGVKVAVFKAPTDVEELIDFKRTALRQGVATHLKIKQTLSDEGLSVVPLLLVQVDSGEESVEQAVTWLKELGFSTDGDSGLIRWHTAAEPDPYLSTIAADETVEVLVFKLAVAIGFDAPRAFTLVSFRPSRDEDFGVQIVGRILRVDRRLQTVKKLPDPLKYGYVFLSDNAGQAGLSSAAQRINAIKTELASVTTNVAVVTIGQGEPSAQVTRKGQPTFFPDPPPASIIGVGEGADDSQLGDENPTAPSIAGIDSGTPPELAQEALWEEWGLTSPANDPGKGGGTAPTKSSAGSTTYTYPMQDLGAPKMFRRAVLEVASEDIVRDIVGRFRFDDDVLLVAQRNAASILMEEVEIFQNRKDRPEEIQAHLAQKEIDAKAQQTLFRADDFDVIDIRALHDALMQQLKKELRRKGINDSFDTDEKLRSGLHKILALRPQQLKRAVSETVVQYTVTVDAADLPLEIRSNVELQPARLNLYGVFPDDLNSWERPFAEYLDNDLTSTVLWWHRNPPRKPFSVSVPLPGQPTFYPDFIVGIRERVRGNGILLVETKRDINDEERNALVKAQAEHPEYKKVMMLYWKDRQDWMVVEYDPVKDKNYLDRVLRPELMVTY